MTITLIKPHDITKGPEKFQTYIFNLQGDTPDQNHSSGVFEYEGEKYRAFRSYRQVTSIKKDGKVFACAQIVAIKVADEQAWSKKGKEGEMSPEVKAKLAEHQAR